MLKHGFGFCAVTVCSYLVFACGCPPVTTEPMDSNNPPSTPIRGACCENDGTCEECTEEQCGTKGGVYQGDDVQCNAVNCPVTAMGAGACCASGECVDGLTESDCGDLDGEFAGLGTLCSDESVSCSLETQPRRELEEVNPDVDFGDFRRGDKVTLRAPEPPIQPNARTRQLDNCQCEWSVDPASGGTLDPFDACTTEFTVGTSEAFLIEVSVNCDDGRSGTFVQDVTVVEFVSAVVAVPVVSPSPAPERATVTLDGSDSLVPGFQTATYLWTLVGSTGPNVAITDPTSEIATFTAPNIPCPQGNSATLTFELRVTEGGVSNSAEVSVEIQNVDNCTQPPGPVTGPVNVDPCAGVVCNDNNACTSDVCAGGVCQFANLANGANCNDVNECTTADVCTNGVCVGNPVANGTPCDDDGAFCTGVETCQAGVCMSAGDPCPGVECLEDMDMCEVCIVVGDCAADDGNPCTGAPTACNAGVCEYANEANGTNCDDGNACTENDECTNGVCGGSPVVCNDNNACNGLETCNPTIGCQDGPDPNCNDGIDCTDDTCNPATGCVNTPDDADCNNGVFCDGVETCNVASGCQAGPDACLDPNLSVCVEATDECVECIVSSDCNAGEFCDTATRTCQPGTPVTGSIRRGDDDGAGGGTLAILRPITVEILDSSGSQLNPRVMDTTSDGTYSMAIPTDEFTGGEFDGRITASGPDVVFEDNEFDIIDLPQAGNLVAPDFIALYEFYVDKDNVGAGLVTPASNTNPGTSTEPFLTIDNVNTNSNSGRHIFAGDTVFVRQGTYTEQVSVLTDGMPTRRITFMAASTDNSGVLIDGEFARNFGFLVGRSGQEQGHYVTVDGFDCTRSNDTTGAAACIAFRNNVGAIIRNNYCYDNALKGIAIWGKSRDGLIEYNHVHNTNIGISVRTTSDFPTDVPINCVVRWNHVHHTDRGNIENADGMNLSGTEDCAWEHNVTHHNIEDGLDDKASQRTLVRYNISYMQNPDNLVGPDGNGIKLGVSFGGDKLIHHNVCFLNRNGTGLVVNVLSGNLGNRVYHNTAWGNGSCGLSISGASVDPLQHSLVFNNLASGNDPGCGIGYDGDSVTEFDYNSNPSSPNTHRIDGDPLFLNTDLIDPANSAANDLNGDGTPDILDPLNDPFAFPAIFPDPRDVEAQILYAKQQVALVFGLADGSPAIDRAVDLVIETPCLTDSDCQGSTCNGGTGFCDVVTDLLGAAGCDDPAVNNPWGDGTAGLLDLGALERTDACP